MQKISGFIVVSIAIIIASCSSNEPKKNEQPGPPTSIEAVKDILKGARFKTEKAGVHFLSTDKEVEWLEPKGENKMEKEVVDGAKSTKLYFMNDTTCLVVVNGKDHSGTYIVDDVVKQEEKPGIKIRISYVDEEFKMGDGPAPMVTYTYLVEGISDKSILLQTPRSLNDKNIIIQMSKYDFKE